MKKITCWFCCRKMVCQVLSWCQEHQSMLFKMAVLGELPFRKYLWTSHTEHWYVFRMKKKDSSSVPHPSILPSPSLPGGTWAFWTGFTFSHNSVTAITPHGPMSCSVFCNLALESAVVVCPASLLCCHYFFDSSGTCSSWLDQCKTACRFCENFVCLNGVWIKGPKH